MDARIWAAIITTVGAIVVAALSFIQKKKSQQIVTMAKREMELQKTKLSFASFITNWEAVERELGILFENTNVDRFLILRAWNGVADPRWTTAILQIRKGNQEAISYIHFELDKDYVTRLKDIQLNGFAHYDVSQMPEGAIKRVYEAEGVTDSIWAFLSKSQEEAGSEAITYCSFATHDEKKLDKNATIRCEIVASMLKGFVDDFE